MESLEMKLKRLAKESEEEIVKIGLGEKLKDNITYKVNYRAKRRFGQCVNKIDINISSWLLEVGVDKDIKNTIIHEILHTFEDTTGHDRKWRYYANMVNNKLGYHIDRCNSIDKVYINANVVPPKQEIHYKYKVTCDKCGKSWKYQRLTRKGLDSFAEGRRVHTGCGCNSFSLEDLETGEVVW